jgi:hypothetical protein
MKPASEEFIARVAAILGRYRRQNGQAALTEADSNQIGLRLWWLIAERGLPPALGPDEKGAPGEMSDDEVAPLVENVLAGSAHVRELATPARQLVKACWLPEFKTCRESYREIGDDGACRRQQLAKARGRISGSHCVDCPYWTDLSPEQHARCLEKGWAGDPVEFASHRDVFLPEDFRALRVWLRAARRAAVK